MNSSTISPRRLPVYGVGQRGHDRVSSGDAVGQVQRTATHSVRGDAVAVRHIIVWTEDRFDRFACKDVYLDRYAEPDKGQTDRDESFWPVPYWYIDTGMAAVNVLHAAVAGGLGALFFGIPTEDWLTLRDTFDVPEAYDPIGAIVVGHPTEQRIESSATTRRRKDIEELVHGGGWDDPFR